MTKRWKALTLTVVAGLAAGLLSACSGGSSSGAGGTDTITIASNAPTFTAAVYVAQDQGFFKAHGVNVDVMDNQGPNVPTLVVSGRADIGIGAPAAEPVLLTSKGQHVTVVYGEGGGGLSASLLVRPGTTLASLQSLQSCKIGTYPQGTSAYGWATIFTKQLGLHCEFSIYQNAPLQVAALTSKSVDAVMGSPSNFSAAVAAGQAQFLIDCSQPADRAKYVPNPPAWESADFGIESNLAKKRPAVQKFFAAYQQGKDWMAQHGPAATAEIVAKSPAAKGTTVQQLTETLTTNAPFNSIPVSTGVITPESWRTSLQFFSSFGLTGYNPDDPAYAYDKVVDMSFVQGK
ncbi:MAG TPA: ABC transporter substrate-binding protein [Amycolatopsis sp.]|nr:ABC transporter substrate-binding protein [Amycolatopsis sp.]